MSILYCTKPIASSEHTKLLIVCLLFFSIEKGLTHLRVMSSAPKLNINSIIIREGLIVLSINKYRLFQVEAKGVVAQSSEPETRVEMSDQWNPCRKGTGSEGKNRWSFPPG